MSKSAHELDSPPWRRVDGTIIATARALRQTYDKVLADLGVTLPEASLVAYVSEEGPLTQTQIAEALDSGRAATGVRIDSLEGRDLVRRLPNPEDRRVWLIEATNDGRNLADRINAVDADFRSSLRAGIDHEERKRLAAVLLRIQDNLDRIDAARELELNGVTS